MGVAVSLGFAWKLPKLSHSASDGKPWAGNPPGPLGFMFSVMQISVAPLVRGDRLKSAISPESNTFPWPASWS